MKVNRRDACKVGMSTAAGWLFANDALSSRSAFAATPHGTPAPNTRQAGGKALRIEVSGICALAVPQATTSAFTLLMPSDSHGPHVPKLAVDARALARSSAQPDETVVTPDGQQLAIWHLTGRSIDIGSPGSALTLNGKDILDMRKAHTTAVKSNALMLRTTSPQHGRVGLSGGTLTGVGVPNTDLEFAPTPNEPAYRGKFAEALVYSVPLPAGNLSLQITGVNPGTIQFDNNGGPVKMAISNHAPQIGSGLQHFGLYYTLLAPGVQARTLQQVHKLTTLGFRPIQCVPPVMIPV